LRTLLAEREPIYAQADLTVHSRDVSHDAIIADIMTALASFLHVTVSPPGKAGA
jgi:shikimate kinase